MNKHKEKICFVMMPFAGEFRDIYEHGIKPAVTEAGLVSLRVDELSGVFNITRKIIESIYQAEILIVDLTNWNPNVFYELGIAHSLAKNVIMITQERERVPFDISTYRVLTYKPTPAGIKEFRNKLIDSIMQALKSPLIDSPVSDFIPQALKVPKSELEAAKAKIEELTSLLKKKEAELTKLSKGDKLSSEAIFLREEIKDYLKSLTEDIIAKNGQETAKLMAINEKLKIENEYLQSAQDELRKLKKMTLVNPHWKGRDFIVEEDLCFLLMPFNEPWSNDVWSLIDGLVKASGYRCSRADEKDGRIVMDDIWEGICKARIVIADLTGKNANVSYEVGLADVLGKEVILLSQTPADVPFDFLGLRLVTYENSIAGVRKLSEQLKKRLSKIRNEK